jgi:hypothetical protein
MIGRDIITRGRMDKDLDNEAGLPWHKPEITRLQVSLDTRFEEGSNTDGYGGSIEPN